MIKKLLAIFTALILFGCTMESDSIFSGEAEGSVTNYENDTHGTYASTYSPLNSENIVIRKRAPVFALFRIKKVHPGGRDELQK